MYILPIFGEYFWASAHFCKNVHTNFEEKMPFLYVHFVFVCTFCGQKPTFFFYLIMIKSLYILYRFGEKMGFWADLYIQGIFCTYKLCIYDRKVV